MKPKTIYNTDSDQDGLTDAVELDRDGLTDLEEVQQGLWPTQHQRKERSYDLEL